MSSLVMASVALALAVQGHAAPSLPTSTRSVPGIAEPRGGAALPSPISVHVDADEQAYQHDLREARREVKRQRRAGQLTRAEARQLRREIALVGEIAERYDRDGLSDSERQELVVRASELRSRTAAGHP